ncbi:MAG TPA: AEC family transporter [Spirochaetia bacterium]|nr:AEC family transporter [Spirochaetia bacterium]
MDNSSQVLINLFPVIALFVLGYLLRRIHFFETGAVGALKKMVVNIALPALLFRAFSSLTFKPQLLVVVVAVFSICILMVLAGRLIGRLLGIRNPYFALLMGGFETGMVGYAIFIAVYGVENVPYLALVDLGQVLFVFFVLMSLLISLRGEKLSSIELARRLVSSPVIISIAAGLLFGLVKSHVAITDAGVYRAFDSLISIVGGLTMPLICVVIGYELEIDRATIGLPLATIGIRTLLLVALAFVMNALVITRLLHLPPMYEKAVLTMFILPPPFVIPLFMAQVDRENMRYVTNTLSVGTIASAAVFFAISVLVP